MLRRAAVSVVVAFVAALWGFSGFFPVTENFGQTLFLVAGGFVILSLLFSLFEDAPERQKPRAVTVPLKRSAGFGQVLDTGSHPATS